MRVFDAMFKGDSPTSSFKCRKNRPTTPPWLEGAVGLKSALNYKNSNSAHDAKIDPLGTAILLP